MLALNSGAQRSLTPITSCEKSPTSAFVTANGMPLFIAADAVSCRKGAAPKQNAATIGSNHQMPSLFFTAQTTNTTAYTGHASKAKL